jgi:hypothetical protein
VVEVGEEDIALMANTRVAVGLGMGRGFVWDNILG